MYLVRPPLEETVLANLRTIQAMWRAGKDTQTIAQALNVPEHAIYNFFCCTRVRK